MLDKEKWLVVRADLLPNVYENVWNVKKMLDRNPQISVSEASEMAGISRSSFYKFHEGVMRLDEIDVTKILNINVKFLNKKGTFGTVIRKIEDCGAKIEVLNYAPSSEKYVEISASLHVENATKTPVEIVAELAKIKGVSEVR